MASSRFAKRRRDRGVDEVGGQQQHAGRRRREQTEEQQGVHRNMSEGFFPPIGLKMGDRQRKGRRRDARGEDGGKSLAEAPAERDEADRGRPAGAVDDELDAVRTGPSDDAGDDQRRAEAKAFNQDRAIRRDETKIEPHPEPQRRRRQGVDEGETEDRARRRGRKHLDEHKAQREAEDRADELRERVDGDFLFGARAFAQMTDERPRDNIKRRGCDQRR